MRSTIHGHLRALTACLLRPDDPYLTPTSSGVTEHVTVFAGVPCAAGRPTPPTSAHPVEQSHLDSERSSRLRQRSGHPYVHASLVMLYPRSRAAPPADVHPPPRPRPAAHQRATSAMIRLPLLRLVVPRASNLAQTSPGGDPAERAVAAHRRRQLTAGLRPAGPPPRPRHAARAPPTDQSQASHAHRDRP